MFNIGKDVIKSYKTRFLTSLDKKLNLSLILQMKPNYGVESIKNLDPYIKIVWVKNISIKSKKWMAILNFKTEFLS